MNRSEDEAITTPAQPKGESMQTDRELLELAAKSVPDMGIFFDEDGGRFYYEMADHKSYFNIWNPLKDDGDAFRLAVKLQLTIDLHFGHIKKDNKIICCIYGIGPPQPSIEDTRNAIVRAAAALAGSGEGL